MTTVSMPRAIHTIDTLVADATEAAIGEGRALESRFQLARDSADALTRVSEFDVDDLVHHQLADLDTHLQAGIETTQKNDVLVPARNALQLVRVLRERESP